MATEYRLRAEENGSRLSHSSEDASRLDVNVERRSSLPSRDDAMTGQEQLWKDSLMTRKEARCRSQLRETEESTTRKRAIPWRRLTCVSSSLTLSSRTPSFSISSNYSTSTTTSASASSHLFLPHRRSNASRHLQVLPALLLLLLLFPRALHFSTKAVPAVPIDFLPS